MKTLIITLLVLFSFQVPWRPSDLKEEICNAFADDNSGIELEEGVEVIYDRELAFDYCVDNISPEAKTDSGGIHYEFELFVCGGSYQDETMSYDPKSKTLEYLAGKGGGDECPYKLEE